MSALPSLALLWALSARAQPAPGCAPLDEAAFAAKLSSARSFLDAEDLDAFSVMQHDVEEHIPCLVFVPAASDWAAHLVDVAVVAYFRGEDWSTPLATALQIAPQIARGVGPEHEIASWTPPAPVPPAGTVPRGITLLVDGTPTTAVPGAGGLHLVQIRDDAGLRSVLLRNAPVPADWIESAQQPSQTPPYALAVSLTGAYGQYAQRVDSPGDYVGPENGHMLNLGGVVQLWAGRTVGATVQVTGPLDPSAHTALGLMSGPLFAGLGASVDTAPYRTDDGVSRVVIAAPVASIQLWNLSPAHADLGLVTSAWPGSEIATTVRAAATIGKQRTRLRPGLAGAWRQQWLAQGEDRELRATDWRLTASLGLAWGAW